MTDFLEQLLELLEEEETQEARICLTSTRPLLAAADGGDTAAKHSSPAGNHPGGAGPALDVLQSGEAAQDITWGAARVAVQGTVRGGTGTQAFRQSGGLLTRTVEEMPDALAGGRAITALSRWEGGGQYAGVRAAGGVQVLERQLAQGAARLWSVPHQDGGTAETVIQTAGPGLEELDRRIRRDARRYDGELTPY